MTEIILTIGLPPKSSSPNSQSHWGKKYRDTKTYRSNCKLCAINERFVTGGIPRWERAEIKATWFKKTKHVIDQDNATAMLKAACDGLQDAEVIINDSGFTWLPHEFKVDTKHPRIELTIRSLDDVSVIITSS